jgi:hypothetical protein
LPSERNDQLIAGFAAAEFDLAIDREKELRFSWLAPDRADAVVCALFVGEPEVTGANLGFVSNADAVMHRSHVFRVQRSADSGQARSAHPTNLWSLAHT